MAAGASVGAILCEYFILKSSIYYFRFGYLSSTFPFFSSFFFLRFVVGAAAATIVGGCTFFFFCCFDSVGAIRRRIISPLRQPEHDATKHTFTNSAYKCKEEEAKKGKKKDGEKSMRTIRIWTAKEWMAKTTFTWTHILQQTQNDFSSAATKTKTTATGKRRKTKSPNLYLWRISRRNIWTCVLTLE